MERELLVHYSTSFDLALWDPTENDDKPLTPRHCAYIEQSRFLFLDVLTSMELNALPFIYLFCSYSYEARNKMS